MEHCWVLGKVMRERYIRAANCVDNRIPNFLTAAIGRSVYLLVSGITAYAVQK
jgi:hypothetical protein